MTESQSEHEIELRNCTKWVALNVWNAGWRTANTGPKGSRSYKACGSCQPQIS